MSMIKDKEFVVFDVETTGLSPMNGDRVVEIAALKIRDFKVVDEFHSLVNPGREISYDAFLVNGISQKMVQDAPMASTVMPAFCGFIEGTCLVGHNVKFDLGFLTNELLLLGLKLHPRTVALDTVKMARVLIPGLNSYSLASVSYSLGITQIQRHRAMSDVQMTWEVFERLRQNAERKALSDWKTWMELFTHQHYPSRRYVPQQPSQNS